MRILKVHLGFSACHAVVVPDQSIRVRILKARIDARISKVERVPDQSIRERILTLDIIVVNVCPNFSSKGINL